MKAYILRQVAKAGATVAALSMAGGAVAAPMAATPVAPRAPVIAPQGITPMPVAPSGVTIVTPATAPQGILPASAVSAAASAPTIAGSGQAAGVFNPSTPAALRQLSSPGGTIFPGTVVPGVPNAAINGIDTGLFLPGNPRGINSFGGLFNPATVFTTSPGNVIVTGGAQSVGTAPSGVIVAGSARGGTQTTGATAGNVVVGASTPAGVQAPGGPVIITGGSGSTVVVPSGGNSSSVIVTGGHQ